MPQAVDYDALAKSSGAVVDYDALAAEHGGSTPTFTQSDTSPNDVDPNTIGAFAKHAGAFLNPVTAVTGAAHAVMHPIDTAKAIADAHLAVFNKAKEEYAKGNTTDAAVHLLNAAIPFFGPSIDKAAEDLREGKYASAFGDAVGIGASVAAPKLIGQALKGRTLNVPGLKNPNAAEAEAVQFGQSRGIPVDAGTATGNRAVKGAQYLADRSFGGSLVATPAKAAQKAALEQVGGSLANDARGAAVTPEQAGQGIRDALASKQQAHTALADQAYEKLRNLEEQPGNRMNIPIAPKAIDGVPSWQAAQLRRMVHELDASGFVKRTINHDTKGIGGNAEVVQGSGGAKVFDDVKGRMSAGANPSRGVMQDQLETYLGGGPETSVVKAALEIAKERYFGRDKSISTPELPASAMQVPTRLEASRVTSEEMGFPVDTTAAKQALRPVYEQMTRQMPITQQQASPGLKAIQNILDGPDHAPLSQVDRDLSAIKAVARQHGGLAKMAAGKLDQAVQLAASYGGPDVVNTLHQGRQATIAKVLTDELIDALPGGKLDEPLAVFKRATAPQDSGIELLRAVKEQTPHALPQIARAKLDELLTLSPDKQFAEWNKVGTETRKILFPKMGQSQDLNHFFLLSKRLAENFNPSGSGELVALGAQGMAFWTNPVASIAAQTGAAGLSTLLHSPAGVRALSKGMSLTLSGKASGAATAAATAEIVHVARSLGLQLAPQAAGSTPTGGTPR